MVDLIQRWRAWRRERVLVAQERRTGIPRHWAGTPEEYWAKRAEDPLHPGFPDLRVKPSRRVVRTVDLEAERLIRTLLDLRRTK